PWEWRKQKKGGGRPTGLQYLLFLNCLDALREIGDLKCPVRLNLRTDRFPFVTILFTTWQPSPVILVQGPRPSPTPIIWTDFTVFPEYVLAQSFFTNKVGHNNSLLYPFSPPYGF